jgi:hypothetical protein
MRRELGRQTENNASTTKEMRIMSSDNVKDEVLKRLDTIIAIMHLAFKDRIDVARQQVLADPISAVILEMAGNGCVEAGELKSRVAQETKQSERTVSRRIAALIAQRALEQIGSGSRVRYRATGLL